jgi:hypothetical protein
MNSDKMKGNYVRADVTQEYISRPRLLCEASFPLRSNVIACWVSEWGWEIWWERKAMFSTNRDCTIPDYRRDVRAIAKWPALFAMQPTVLPDFAVTSTARRFSQSWTKTLCACSTQDLPTEDQTILSGKITRDISSSTETCIPLSRRILFQPSDTKAISSPYM